MLFNVRDLTSDLWLSWEEVELWAEEIQVPTVPVLHRGVFNSVNDLKLKINEFMSMPSCFGKEREGVVVRVKDSFSDSDFSKCLGKFVRKNHVNTSIHWTNQEIIRNGVQSC